MQTSSVNVVSLLQFMNHFKTSILPSGQCKWQNMNMLIKAKSCLVNLPPSYPFFHSKYTLFHWIRFRERKIPAIILSGNMGFICHIHTCWTRGGFQIQVALPSRTGPSSRLPAPVLFCEFCRLRPVRILLSWAPARLFPGMSLRPSCPLLLSESLRPPGCALLLCESLRPPGCPLLPCESLRPSCPLFL